MKQYSAPAIAHFLYFGFYHGVLVVGADATIRQVLPHFVTVRAESVIIETKVVGVTRLDGDAMCAGNLFRMRVFS